MQTHNDEQGRAKVRELIKDVHVCLMVTHGIDAQLHARPMVAMKEQEGSDDLWFFTSRTSGKIEEINADASVLLAYSEPQTQTYVSVYGKAVEVDDRAKIKALWSEFLRTWFPKGSDDPGITLIRVTPYSAEYWDIPSSALVYAYGYVKARLTGESPKPGDVGHVDFDTPLNAHAPKTSAM